MLDFNIHNGMVINIDNGLPTACRTLVEQAEQCSTSVRQVIALLIN
jgi:hypothetical protein